jgi:branched-chain amino acid aminotransferase
MEIDWESLGFSYMDTNCHVRYTCRDAIWDDGIQCDEPFLNIHIAATALHYGQSAFEGLKAFSCKDGSVRVFRAEENARRLMSTAERIMMTPVPETLFLDAIERTIRANLDFVPPYGTGGSLYIRPMLFGSGPQIGVHPSTEYTFIVFVIPVGDYYKGGLTPVSAMVMDEYDRAAPNGVGHVKVAGNYSPGLRPSMAAKDEGFPIVLYLDAAEHRYVDEFGTSNFIAITNDGKYVTPASSSILPSVTNKTLMALAEAEGLTVERRQIAFDEVGDFSEAAACGTAVVITPVNRFVRAGDVIEVGPREGSGPVFERLYKKVRGIQVGELPDDYGWTRIVQ